MKRIIKPEEITIDFFVRYSLPHQSSFIKTALLKQLGLYRTDFRVASDWAFFLEAIKNGASYKYIPVSVSVFMAGGTSEAPENTALIHNEREKVWKELFPDTYKEIFHLAELKAELKRAYKIPGVKFIMKYIYPLHWKLRAIFRI